MFRKGTSLVAAGEHPSGSSSPQKADKPQSKGVVSAGSSKGHHDVPLSLEGTFTLQHVGKPARRAEQFQARHCCSRKFLCGIRHCSQNTRSQGKELSLLSSPPCSAGQRGVNQDYLLGFQPSRLTEADSWHTGMLLWELLCPQHEPGHRLRRGRTQTMLCFSRIRGTTSYSASCTPEPKKSRLMEHTRLCRSHRTTDQPSLACAKCG